MEVELDHLWRLIPEDLICFLHFVFVDGLLVRKQGGVSCCGCCGEDGSAERLGRWCQWDREKILNISLTSLVGGTENKDRTKG